MLRLVIVLGMAVIITAGCDYMGDKKDEKMEEKRHAQEIREALQYEREQKERRELERANKLRIAEENRKAELEKMRMAEERRQLEREERRKAEELRRIAMKKENEYREKVSVLEKGRINWWENAPRAEKRLRAITNCTYLCVLRHPVEGRMIIEFRSSQGKIEGGARLEPSGDKVEIPKEECLQLVKSGPMLASRLTGTRFDGNLYVWNAKNKSGTKYPVPSVNDAFSPAKEELDSLYGCVGGIKGRNSKRTYRIYLHRSSTGKGEPVCDVGVGDEVTRDVFEDYLYASLFEEKEARLVAEIKERERRESLRSKKKKKVTDPSMTAFRTITNVAGKNRGLSVERWDRVGRRREDIEQKSRMPEYNSTVSVSSKEIDSILENCKISYQVQNP